MSNIYIQEPPTNGKVLLSTSVGDIDIELWPREAPKACRNFVQLCLEGYYDGTIFHRVVKDFIVQGGDPTGTGDGGESIYGKPFKDEFHTRLRFVRRGLVAMANAGQNDNGSQFFITMGPTQELQNKHTIFGKIGGDTIYNVLRLQDCEVDANDRPVYPHKIKSTKVLSNPFDDIEPRLKQTTYTDDDQKQRSKKKGTKNFSLLSFGEEAEEEEEVLGAVTKERKGKSKSSHDLIDDPTLSTVTAVDVEDSVKRKIEDPDAAESVRKKLKESSSESKEKKVTDNIPSDDDELSVKQKRRDELRKEAKELQRELLGKSKQKKEKEENENNQKKSKEPANDLVASYMQEKQKYQNIKKSQQKGTSREEQTMALLNKFKSKLESVKKLAGDYDDEGEDDDEKTEKNGEEEEESADDISWLRHKLTFEKSTKAALDANVRELDRYEISDPRNPLTQRRREASKQVMKEKK